MGFSIISIADGMGMLLTFCSDCGDRFKKLIKPPAACSNCPDNRHCKQFREAFLIDGITPSLCHINHIQGDDDRPAKLCKLHRQVEVPFKI